MPTDMSCSDRSRSSPPPPPPPPLAVAPPPPAGLPVRVMPRPPAPVAGVSRPPPPVLESTQPGLTAQGGPAPVVAPGGPSVEPAGFSRYGGGLWARSASGFRPPTPGPFRSVLSSACGPPAPIRMVETARVVSPLRGRSPTRGSRKHRKRRRSSSSSSEDSAAAGRRRRRRHRTPAGSEDARVTMLLEALDQATSRLNRLGSGPWAAPVGSPAASVPPAPASVPPPSSLSVPAPPLAGPAPEIELHPSDSMSEDSGSMRSWRHCASPPPLCPEPRLSDPSGSSRDFYCGDQPSPGPEPPSDGLSESEYSRLVQELHSVLGVAPPPAVIPDAKCSWQRSRAAGGGAATNPSGPPPFHLDGEVWDRFAWLASRPWGAYSRDVDRLFRVNAVQYQELIRPPPIPSEAWDRLTLRGQARAVGSREGAAPVRRLAPSAAHQVEEEQRSIDRAARFGLKLSGLQLLISEWLASRNSCTGPSRNSYGFPWTSSRESPCEPLPSVGVTSCHCWGCRTLPRGSYWVPPCSDRTSSAVPSSP